MSRSRLLTPLHTGRYESFILFSDWLFRIYDYQMLTSMYRMFIRDLGSGPRSPSIGCKRQPRLSPHT
jgi:hypothetical protein